MKQMKNSCWGYLSLNYLLLQFCNVAGGINYAEVVHCSCGLMVWIQGNPLVSILLHNCWIVETDRQFLK
jgi:hypothetical protein